MLKHNPKLKRLWNKAPKIRKGDMITLDRRYKVTREFGEELVKITAESIVGNEKEINDLISWVLKQK